GRAAEASEEIHLDRSAGLPGADDLGSVEHQRQARVANVAAAEPAVNLAVGGNWELGVLPVAEIEILILGERGETHEALQGEGAGAAETERGLRRHGRRHDQDKGRDDRRANREPHDSSFRFVEEAVAPKMVGRGDWTPGAVVKGGGGLVSAREARKSRAWTRTRR